MAKVKCTILQGMAGIDYTYQKGSIQEIEKEEAKKLMEAGVVEIISKPKPITREAKAFKKATKRTK